MGGNMLTIVTLRQNKENHFAFVNYRLLRESMTQFSGHKKEGLFVYTSSKLRSTDQGSSFLYFTVLFIKLFGTLKVVVKI